MLKPLKLNNYQRFVLSIDPYLRKYDRTYQIFISEKQSYAYSMGVRCLLRKAYGIDYHYTRLSICFVELGIKSNF